MGAGGGWGWLGEREGGEGSERAWGAAVRGRVTGRSEEGEVRFMRGGRAPGAVSVTRVHNQGGGGAVWYGCASWE